MPQLMQRASQLSGFHATMQTACKAMCFLSLQHTVFYWTQDTTQICFRGSHFWLTMTVGLPGALLICVGIPAGFAGELWSSSPSQLHCCS